MQFFDPSDSFEERDLGIIRELVKPYLESLTEAASVFNAPVRSLDDILKEANIIPLGGRSIPFSDLVAGLLLAEELKLYREGIPSLSSPNKPRHPFDVTTVEKLLDAVEKFVDSVEPTVPLQAVERLYVAYQLLSQEKECRLHREESSPKDSSITGDALSNQLPSPNELHPERRAQVNRFIHLISSFDDKELRIEAYNLVTKIISLLEE